MLFQWIEAKACYFAWWETDAWCWKWWRNYSDILVVGRSDWCDWEMPVSGAEFHFAPEHLQKDLARFQPFPIVEGL